MYFDKAKALFTNHGVRLWKGLLQKIYHFDKWHIVSLRQRKYARDVIAYCNQREVRNTFLEIGCGLGDIIRNVKYENRLGYDNDQRVLEAAAFLDKLQPSRWAGDRKKSRFSVFNFPASAISGKHDVILMVNWIHHIEPSVLQFKIEEYFTHFLNDGGAIIIDTILDKEYKFNHDIQFLTNTIPAAVTRLGDYERQRQIWIIKK